MDTAESSAHHAHPSTVEVASNSRPGLFHAVTLEPESCSCEVTVPVCRHIQIARIRAVKSRPHACNDGWVTLGQTVVDPDTGEEMEEFALYLCRRCADSL
jgi:hypothetical protein